LGLNEKRLLRLLLWTAVDIRATNPEAWNEWKAKLLSDLVGKILAGGTKNFLDLRRKLPKGLTGTVIESLDPQLFDLFSAKTLKEDLEMALKTDQSWAYRLDSRKKLWIRYSQTVDRPGILSEALEKIYSAGGSIQTALIHSFPADSGKLGVYDWFQVQTSRDPASFFKLLQQLRISEIKIPAAQFLKIDWVSQNSNEWVLSFRGVDQKGLLLAAAWNLKDLGAQVQSARVHTWGRQIEDLFHIQPLSHQEPQVFLEQLRARLL
jgi:[protein-PII] uridylyltransferase